MTASMRWASAISTRASLEAAVTEVTQQATQQLGITQPGVEPTLAFVFISTAFVSEYSRLLPLLHEQLNVDHIIGCSGTGVVGMADDFPEEVEEGPALSLTLAYLPNVTVKSFHLTGADLPDLDSPPTAWSKLLGVEPAQQPNFILMADPFSSGTSELLQGMDFAYPGCPKVGGLAGLESFNNSSGLFCHKKVHKEGIVGVALSGEIVLETIVAQGCRPIGELYRVSEGERNIMLKLTKADEADELGDRTEDETPLEILQNIFQGLNEEDRELAQNALFIGVAQSGFKPSLTRRDFLIRNLVGVDPRNGSIAVADKIRPGMRIQFHMRDAQTSAEDLENLLRRYRVERLEDKIDSTAQSASPVGALLFSCTGRGVGLYEESNFDSDLFEQYLGPLPIGGFFCNGEIGPVGTTTFLHGFTSVFGICCQPNNKVPENKVPE
ncbi:MAG: FIST N-terminal domain-containing protein [Cyanobacteria bacterium J06598_3]